MFYCHLVLEKLFKGLVVAKTQDFPLYSHDLPVLAEKGKVELKKEEKENLKVINNFNISARYDNIKFDFYKICDKKYTEKYLDISNSLRLWLKEQFPEK